jgi:hypothetical protein
MNLKFIRLPIVMDKGCCRLIEAEQLAGSFHNNLPDPIP